MDVPDRIEVNNGATLVLSWPDGSTSSIGAADLRRACECAACQALEGPAQIADPGQVRIVSASVVGAYAVTFSFEPDHHDTGIYPFDRLRALGEAG